LGHEVRVLVGGVGGQLGLLVSAGGHVSASGVMVALHEHAHSYLDMPNAASDGRDESEKIQRLGRDVR
jgi:hypothetical protein